MADLPNPGDDLHSAGEIGLPAAVQGAGGFGNFGGFGGGGDDSGPAGAVDLPTTAAARPGASFGAPAPAFSSTPTMGGAFGVLDLGNEDAGGAVDLPATRSGPQNPFGGIGLPAPQSPFDHHDEAGLPAVFGGPSPSGAGLPAPRAGGVGLPAPAGGGAGLPAYSGGAAGLPSPGGGTGLPAYSGAAGLPSPGGGGAGLPMPSAGGLPAYGGGVGFPSTSHAGLPSPSGGAGLPVIGGAGLPSTSAGGLPMAAGAGLPSTSHAGLPVVGAAGFPTTAGPGLPSPLDAFPAMGGPGLPSPLDHFPAPAGAGLPSPAGAGLPATLGRREVGEAGSGIDFGEEVNVGSSGGAGGASIGGEMDLGGAPALGGSAAIARRDRQHLIDSDEAPAKSSGRALKLVAAGMVVVVLGGVSLALVPSVGPFGINFIQDKLYGDRYETDLVELRRAAGEDLATDTLTAMNNAMLKARTAHEGAPRHQETAAYAAYVLYLRGIRFGRDGASESEAKGLLDKIDRTRISLPIQLASAAEDTLAGQLARARQTLSQAQQAAPEDMDVAVLSGEVELIAKEPEAAIKAFTRALGLGKSARALYGLARAQLAVNKATEAEATAKSVLESSPGHVGARTLLARVAAGTSSREAEALALLKAVTSEEAIRANASQTELVEAYIQLGRVQLLGSRMSLAQEAFGEALKIDPQAVAALVGSGELFYRSGRFSEAEGRFESALRADADNVDAKIGQAKTWIALERQKEAKELLTKLQTTQANDPRVFYWLARVEESLGKRKDAEALFGEAIKRADSPENGVPAYVALSHLMAGLGRTEEATRKLNEAAEKYPDSPELARARGDLALQTGRYGEAQAQYEEALKKAPDDLATRFSLGQTLRKMRKFDEAVAVFDMVAKVDKDYPGLALERGLYYEETGQNDQALQMYNEALQRAPGDVDLKLRVGSTLVAAGQAKQAELILKDVIRERANSAEANHFYGRALLLAQSNLNEAMRHLKKAIELDSNRAEYYLYVGWAANEIGQPQLAETSLARAIELDSSLGDAYWQRGVLQQKQGRTTDAIEDLNVALEKRPSRYEAYATLALCYEEQNNWTKADETWRKAIDGNDKIADWHFRLGKLLARRKDSKAALVELEKSVEQAALRDPKPGWLSDAHLDIGDLLRGSDKEKALFHYAEFLRLAPLDNAYRKDAEDAIRQLKR